MKRIVILGVALAILIVFGVVLTTRLDVNANAVESALVGEPVPDFELELLDGGGTVSTDDLEGDVVVVNFWASWCQPCRKEHAELAATAEAYADRGVRFLGIVYQNDAEDARAFLDDLGRSYDNVVDPDSETAIDFGLFGVPETFVVDRRGVVAGNVAGPVDEALLSATLDRVLGDG